jgi:DNA-directed RNA polymerase subunit beta'
MDNLRKYADREVDRIEKVWDRFKNLKVNDLEGDESLYRDMVHRFGLYFTGAMGAEAIQKRLIDFDLEAEAEMLRELIKPPARASARPVPSSASRSSTRS